MKLKLNSKYYLLMVVFIAFFAEGCVGIRISSMGPLEEVVIEGSGRDRILIVDISGVIKSGEARDVLGNLKKTSITSRIRETLMLAEKPGSRVKAVILRINSPGGEVTTTDIIYHEIISFKERTGIPVITEMMGVAASGGYYVAAATDKIMAHPTTITGSVGVISLKVNATGLFKKLGLKSETIKSGKNKDMGSPLKDMTAAERKLLQAIIDDLFGRFKDIVRKGRPEVTNEAFKRIFDGRVFTAGDALAIGLIDKIGYLDDAISEAKKVAGLTDATVVIYGRPGSFKSNIYSRLALSGAPTVNMLNIDAGGLLSNELGVRFMYLWMPGS